MLPDSAILPCPILLLVPSPPASTPETPTAAAATAASSALPITLPPAASTLPWSPLYELVKGKVKTSGLFTLRHSCE